jgi:hypothetical protein
MTRLMSAQTNELTIASVSAAYSAHSQTFQNHILAQSKRTTPIESHPCEKTPGGGGPHVTHLRLPVTGLRVGLGNARY